MLSSGVSSAVMWTCELPPPWKHGSAAPGPITASVRTASGGSGRAPPSLRRSKKAAAAASPRSPAWALRRRRFAAAIGGAEAADAVSQAQQAPGHVVEALLAHAPLADGGGERVTVDARRPGHLQIGSAERAFHR